MILNRKIRRDLMGMKGQVLAIIMVIVSGVATFIISVSTLDSLKKTRESFYQEYRFADVFAPLKRAPASLIEAIRVTDGIDQVETRIVADIRLEVPNFPDPVTGRLISIPDRGQPLLNRLYLRQGRLVDPGRDDEVVASEAFSEAHGLRPGNQIRAIINGRLKALTIVGIALSPEYIYQIGPGSIFPDFKRFGVFWMARTPLAGAYNMEGAFNDVVATVSPKADVQDLINRLDLVLGPYGGIGAYSREDQLSNRYISEEFKQLGTMAAIFPAIFLGVAAFLLSMVMKRLIDTQREQIAILKAFGYENLQIGWHYIKFILVIVAAGILGGIFAGMWLGKALSGLYAEFYRFPYLRYELRPALAVAAGLISLAASGLGTFRSVRQATLLPPAEAMRTEAPVTYRVSLIERLGLRALLSQPSRMIIRHIARAPVKSLLSLLGIALACAIMMLGRFQKDAIDFMIYFQFGLSQRQDMTVNFIEPTSWNALYSLQSLPGLQYVEPFRAVPVRLRYQNRNYRTSVQGLLPHGHLQRLIDTNYIQVEIPPSGLILTDYLAKMLGVRPGEEITAEFLEGARPVRQIPLSRDISEFIGVSAYMDIGALNRLLREDHAISGAYILADPFYQQQIVKALNTMPRIAGIVIKKNAIQNFYETSAQTMLIFTFINTLLAGTIAFGVVYNNARIALSERSRELASLRVLGFTRAEISYILLGELGLLTLGGIPLGFLVGRAFCAFLVQNSKSELYRVPLIIEPGTYAFAAVVVLASAFISGLVIKRKLDRLDLVAVLKMRE